MRRPPPLLLAAVVSLLALLGLGASALPATAGPRTVPLSDDESDYVIIAGAAGLRWDDIDVERTPTLWALAERGAIGSLSTRSAHVPTCPGDGWLTLGAGNYAERTRSEVAQVCPRLDVAIELPDAIGASLPDQHAVVERQRELSFGTVPGALAESVRCTTAVGPGAAVAAAHSFGRVDRYAPELPADPTSTLSKCLLSIVDLGAVDGLTPQRRAKQVAAADALLARILKARPERSTLLVAGVSDTDRTSRLHVVIADGQGWRGGWLTSASTNRPGYLELVDLAPTALSLLGKEVPKKVMAGHPAAHALGRPDDLGEATAAGTDADRQAAAARNVSAWFFLLLAAAQILLFAAVVPLLRRSYRHAGPTGPTPPPERLVRLLELLLVGAALAVPAALITGIVPWWRFGQRGLIFFAVTGAVLAVLTLVTVRLPVSRTRTLGPVGAVAAIAAAVVGLDLITGARLQLNGVAGYSALEGGRYSGIGMVGMGVFFAAVLLTAACLAQLVPQRRRPLLVGVVGVVPVLLVGTPAWGADAGGAIALTAGVCLTAAFCPGGWLSFRRLAVALGIGLVVAVGFAYVDLHRPVEQQGSLGRFLAQWADGTSGLTLNRLGSANRIALVTSPLTVLALVAAVFMWAVLMRPWGGLKRLYGIYPPIKAAVFGIAVSSVLAGLLGGAALNVAGTAAATALPLLTLGAMRVLGHAADRTRIVEESVSADTPVGVSGM
ncbi:hypothetical protein QEZ54_30225 [Catellatospora sp. KI3]|uniref:hypothetical protein n=1 Tax=Catellatospora sp. KI3 TaxID=3041620 RepID=UPI002482952A|nr:hypothetical protein [Catellatospora sp. KI3]MDI1465252.1 hypothetical protein [Catellatospora sp. KI3]